MCVWQQLIAGQLLQTLLLCVAGGKLPPAQSLWFCKVTKTKVLGLSEGDKTDLVVVTGYEKYTLKITGKYRRDK